VAAEASPLPPTRLRPFAALRNLVVFLAGLAAAASVLVALVPFPKMGNLSRKDQHYRKHRDDYSLVYVGSSRVFHEFIPKQFDAALAARGQAVKSFNFGQDGMWPPESLYMVRKIIAQRSPKLRWVLIDLMDIKVTFGEGEVGATTLRALYWHDWQHTMLAWQHLIEVDRLHQRTWEEKLTLCAVHASLWLERATALGEGNRRVEFILKLAQEKQLAPVPDEGFEVGGSGPLQGEALNTFTQELTRLKTNPPAKPINAALRRALDGIVRDLTEANLQPVFVIASSLYGAERFSDWLPTGVPVLAFDDPAKYPQLADPAHRFDPHHLDAVGAAEFTRLLAGRFAEILEARR
jgi:hypothetical protein